MVLSKNINFQCWKITKKQQKEKKEDKKKIKFKKKEEEKMRSEEKNKIILYSFLPAFLFIKYFEILIGSKNIL